MKKPPPKVLHLGYVTDVWSIQVSYADLTILPTSLSSVSKDLGEMSYLLNGATKSPLLSNLFLGNKGAFHKFHIIINVKLRRKNSELLVDSHSFQ